MRKVLLTIAIFAMILGMSNCDNDGGKGGEEDLFSGDNPFVGTWENEDGTRLVFTKIIATDYKPDGDIYWKGSYTYDDEYITINWEYKVEELEIWGDTFTPWYKFENEMLVFGGIPFSKISDNN